MKQSSMVPEHPCVLLGICQEYKDLSSLSSGLGLQQAILSIKECLPETKK